MNLLLALNALILLTTPNAVDPSDIEPINFRIQVYPYGGYYSYPPYCPPGYSYGPGLGYRGRGFSFYYGPGYGYRGRCYWGQRNYYAPRYYYYKKKKGHRRK
jgi:hypothetical protein